MIKEDFFEEYLNEEITLDNLHEQWRQLPSVYHHYTDELTELGEEKELASVALDNKKADIDDEVRRDPDKYNLSKTTETTVLGAVNREIVNTKEWENYLITKKKFNLTQNKIKRLDKKDRALSKLVDLYQSAYFIGPKEPITTNKKSASGTTKRQRRSLKK